jgi:two-component system nitrogen regulation sensor histidine kinase NtrY
MRFTTLEGKGGWRGVLYLVTFLFLTALAIVLQLQYRGFEGPLSDNILIFILINANFLLLAAVIFMAARSLWKLWMERRQGVLGARFRTKLVFAFVSLSFIPPVLLFLIGSGMFTRSIERLVSLRIENSLKDSVTVAQAYYDRLQKEATAFARQISAQMADAKLVPPFQKKALESYLAGKADEYGLGSVELFTSPRERAVVVVTRQYPLKTFSLTPSDLVAGAFAGKETADVTGSAKKGDIMRAVVPLYEASGEGKRVVAAVAVSYYISQNLATKSDSIREGYAQYRSAFSKKDPIKLSYRLAFLSITLALLLAAIWVAIRVAEGITVPITKLAEGTAAVAAGRFDYRIDEKSNDEVGVLIASFNKMTSLQHSREQSSRGQLQEGDPVEHRDRGRPSTRGRSRRSTSRHRSSSASMSRTCSGNGMMRLSGSSNWTRSAGCSGDSSRARDGRRRNFRSMCGEGC